MSPLSAARQDIHCRTLAPCSFITVKEIFDIIDTDHSGELDIREVRKLIGKLYHISHGQSLLSSECLWSLFFTLDLDPLRDGIDSRGRKNGRNRSRA